VFRVYAFILIFLFAGAALFALQLGIIYNGNMNDQHSFVGISARSQVGIVGLELAALPQITPDFDFSSWRFLISPSIGWGTPELRIFGAVAPHFDLVKGELDFDISKWRFGAGSTFMFAPNVIGFFEFFVEFDFARESEAESLSSGTLLSVGVSYNFDLGF